MAKSQKQQKQTQPSVNPVAAAVAAAYAQCLPVLKAQAAQTAANQAAATSRSKAICGAIRMLYDSIKDPAAFKDAWQGLFGDGSQKKDGTAIKGSLRTDLEAAGVKDVQVWNSLHQAREVCAGFTSEAVRTAAETKGLRGAYDVRPGGAKDPAKTAEKPKAETPANVGGVTFEAYVGACVQSEGWVGLARMLRVLSSASSVLKDPIKAEAITAAAVRVAA
jgi:hypothetical protein